MSEPFGLRLGDLQTFLHIASSGSVSAAARQLQVTVSQVSKSLARLEQRIGKTLVARSARGIALTEDGKRLLPRIQAVAFELRALTATEAQEGRLTVTIVAPSFLVESVVPMLIARVRDARYRIRTASPAEIRGELGERRFDVALLPGEDRAPAGWIGETVGEVRNGLFGSPELVAKLGRMPVVESRIRQLTFVQPLRTDPLVVRPTTDGCPLPVEDRLLGDEVQTFPVAAELAAHGDQVVFGPTLAARHLLRAGLLEEIDVRGWASTTPVQLFVSDAMPSSFCKKVLTATRAVLIDAVP
ncbi:MAG: LysR family transcriptional regulator [Myxococcales bacterium]|nr:LysR family transcriptional regulator [Myxococcales bacterium]